MNTKFTLITGILFLTIFSFGQQNSINQFDSEGKKDGKWIEYLDNYWHAIEDSTQALYFRYTFYDHGYNIYKAIKYTRIERVEPIDNANASTNEKKIIILNGEYKWYDDQGRLMTHECYKNGDFVWCKSYIWGIAGNEYHGKKLHEYFDYTKKFENQLNSFYYESYDKNGVLTKWYLRKDNKDYKFIETK